MCQIGHGMMNFSLNFHLIKKIPLDVKFLCQKEKFSQEEIKLGFFLREWELPYTKDVVTK